MGGNLSDIDQGKRIFLTSTKQSKQQDAPEKQQAHSQLVKLKTYYFAAFEKGAK